MWFDAGQKNAKSTKPKKLKHEELESTQNSSYYRLLSCFYVILCYQLQEKILPKALKDLKVFSFSKVSKLTPHIHIQNLQPSLVLWNRF